MTFLGGICVNNVTVKSQKGPKSRFNGQNILSYFFYLGMTFGLDIFCEN